MRRQGRTFLNIDRPSIDRSTLSLPIVGQMEPFNLYLYVPAEVSSAMENRSFSERGMIMEGQRLALSRVDLPLTDRRYPRGLFFSFYYFNSRFLIYILSRTEYIDFD